MLPKSFSRIFAAACAVAAATCAYADSIITEWQPVINRAIIKDAGAPTPSTHVLASVYSAAYDAWAAYDPTAEGYATGNNLDVAPGAFAPADVEASISHAIYNTLIVLTPSNVDEFDSFMAAFGLDADDAGAPAMLGRAVAREVLAIRQNDGSNQTIGYRDTSGYGVSNASLTGSWQPLVNDNVAQTGVTPHWGNVLPFALSSGDELRPVPPAEPGTAEWDAQIEEIIEVSANLTPKQKAIAEYWRPKDGTPPMILMGLTAKLSRDRSFTLDQDAKLFFAATNAMLDAGIATWESKYYYNYLRPVTAIRALGDRQIVAWAGPNLGTQTIAAKDWLPYQHPSQLTPPFPEYTSGHSAFSRAWAEVMESFTGSPDFNGSVTIDGLDYEDFTFDPPLVLAWPTFEDAALEAGISRIYGGIHFSDGNVYGLAIGKSAGEKTWAQANRYFDGTAKPIFAALSNPSAALWSPAGNLPFTLPIYSTGMGLGLEVANGGNSFGYWQSGILDPLASGQYRFTFFLEASNRQPGKRLPEVRARVFRADNRESSIGIAVQTNPEQEFPDRLEILYDSDGAEQLRLAVDVLAFDAGMAGRITVTGIAIKRLSGN